MTVGQAGNDGGGRLGVTCQVGRPAPANASVFDARTPHLLEFTGGTLRMDYAILQTVDRRRDRLVAELRASFEDLPVEDGVEHPAERIIAKVLAQAGDKRAIHWLKDLCVDVSQPTFAASVLRCLARVDCAGPESWRVGLVRDGLTKDSVEIRDAAIQAAETWGDCGFLEVLKAHSESVSWLRQYLSDVIDDLSE